MLGFMFVLHIGGDEENRTPVRRLIPYIIQKSRRITVIAQVLLLKYQLFSIKLSMFISIKNLPTTVDRKHGFRYNLKEYFVKVSYLYRCGANNGCRISLPSNSSWLVRTKYFFIVYIIMLIEFQCKKNKKNNTSTESFSGN